VDGERGDGVWFFGIYIHTSTTMRPRGDMVGFGPLLMCDNRLRTSILAFLVGHMRIHKKFITPPCIYSIFMT
jgi:hypothetical protein